MIDLDCAGVPNGQAGAPPSLPVHAKSEASSSKHLECRPRHARVQAAIVRICPLSTKGTSAAP